jgi:hypothetical protein
MKDLLQLNDGDLSKALGKILQSKPYECKDYMTKDAGLVGYRCVKCKIFRDLDTWENSDFECEYPDPIPLDDWNVAKNYIGKFSVNKIIIILMEIFSLDKDKGERVSKDVHWISFCTWLVNEVRPKHYLVASAECKRRDNER